MTSFYTQSYFKENTFTKKDGLYVNQRESFLNVTDENHTFYHFELHPGFVTDGGSVPKLFQWFMPSWDDNNMLLNLAYAIHDYCYGSEKLAKPIADDLLRSVLRDAGYDRFHASTVCWCVNNFANKHYGIEHDKYNCRNYGEMIVL